MTPPHIPDMSQTKEGLPEEKPLQPPRIEGYRIVKPLGQGGMGILYLADQIKPIQRRVAIKVIKPGMDSQQVLARFEAERQTLALLDYPNVAHVYDAGSTDKGYPYFVMEYIRGIHITQFCDDQKLNLYQRLKLFLQVCKAINYAHQKGIIHRDIKPSNILVSVQGNKVVSKVIDFGIAKAIDQSATEQTLFTEQGQWIGTPEYMSPEQAVANCQDIDIRSDIYSLGVLLYELLTGTLPFDRKSLREAAMAEIQRVICNEDPPHPSTKLSSLGEDGKKIAENRKTKIDTLSRKLRRELEWIPLKALRKEKDQRYQSVSDLYEDIQNYLTGKALVAGPESISYLFCKFVKRHSVIVTGLVLLFFVLITGIAVSTHYAMGQDKAFTEIERKTRSTRLLVDRILAYPAALKIVAEYSPVSGDVQSTMDSVVAHTFARAFHKLGIYEEAKRFYMVAIDRAHEAKQHIEPVPDTIDLASLETMNDGPKVTWSKATMNVDYLVVNQKPENGCNEDVIHTKRA